MGQFPIAKRYPYFIAGILVFLGLYLASLYSYLLFHSLAEIFSIVVACGIFMVTWNSRRFLDNNYLLFLGIAYLFAGGLDLIHTLTYKGMGIFQGYGTNPATQLWIAARYTESLSLLIAPLFIRRKLKINLLFFSYLLAFLLLLMSIFYWNIFPICFVEGVGLTPFKKISEYIISLILLASIALLLKNRSEFDRDVLKRVVWSIVLTIASELAFTFYIDAYGFSNLLGHFLKIVSFYLIYKALIEMGLTRPYDLLFRNLKQGERMVQAEKNKIQNYLDIAGVILVATDANQNVSLINKKGCEILGYEEKEIIGKNWFDAFIPEGIREEVKAEFRKLMNGEVHPIEYFENPVLTKTREERMIAWHNAVLRDEKGNGVSTLSSGEDITERKKMEEELTRLASFPQLNPNPIVEVDLAGHVHYSNPAAERLFPDLKKAGLNHPWPMDLEKISEALKTGSRKTYVRELRVGDRWYQQTIHSVMEGTRLRIYGFDITARKGAEQALREAKYELEIKVKERTAELQQTNERLKEENQERIRTEQSLRLEEARLDALLHLSQISEAPLKEITGFTLEQAIGLTNSKIGFVGFLNEDESVYTLHAVSKDVVKECNVTGDPLQWHVVDAGIWADAIRERRTLFVNDYSKPHPRKKGLPPGHPYVQRFMVVPILEGKRIVAVAGVGNKASDYDKSDERQIVLLLTGMWGYVQKNLSREEVAKANELLERMFSSIDVCLAYMDRDFNFIGVNRAYAEADGRDPKFYVGKNHFVLFPNEENEQIFRRVVETGEPYSVYAKPFEYTEHPERGITHWDWSLQPVKDPDGSVGGVILSLVNVTGRTLAEEEMKRSERILGGFFASTITPLVLLDKNFNFIRVNEAYAKACHRKVSEFSGHNHFEFYPSDAKAKFEQVVQTKQPYVAIARPFSFPDHPEWGASYWDWTLTPVLDDTGEVEYLVFSLEDVTQRKRAEEAVRGERQRFYDVLEMLPAYLVLLTPDYHVPFANRFFRERFGESHGNRCFEFLFGRSEPCEICETYTVLKTIAPHQWEWTGPDGRTYDVIDFPFTDTDGSTLILEMGIDITERKRAEEALRAAHQYNRSLIEASLDPLVTVNEEGKITDVNSATELATGVPREQLIGSDFFDCFTQPEKAKEGYQAVFSRGTVRDYPLAIRHRSGMITDVLYNATIYRNEAGEIQGVFAAARDITERKRAEEALKESEARLRALSSQLLTAHESERKRIAMELHDGIGQMLTAIKFKAENILEGKEKPRAKDKSLGAIIPLIKETIEEVRRMQMDLRPSTLDDLGVLATLGWFCREYQKIYSPIRVEKEIAIQENEVSTLLKVVLYRLTQEAMNNIAKHSHADLVRLSLRKQENKIEWSVEDNGMGFNLEEVLSSEGSKRGLGLSSMRERAQLSGGTFTIESTPGKGTSIRASWPL